MRLQKNTGGPATRTVGELTGCAETAKSFTPSVENTRNVRQRITELNTTAHGTLAPSPFTGTAAQLPTPPQNPFAHVLQQQQATANDNMLEMMKKLLQSELGPLKHEVDRLNSRVNNMDIVIPPQEEAEDDAADDATGVRLALQNAKAEDAPVGVRSSRPVRSCTQFHPYKK